MTHTDTAPLEGPPAPTKVSMTQEQAVDFFRWPDGRYYQVFIPGDQAGHRAYVPPPQEGQEPTELQAGVLVYIERTKRNLAAAQRLRGRWKRGRRGRRA